MAYARRLRSITTARVTLLVCMVAIVCVCVYMSLCGVHMHGLTPDRVATAADPQ